MENRGRGIHFERRVQNRLVANFPDRVLLHNVRIPGRKGNPTQIDFILFDETGIYVIEAKCYSGTVRGTENQIWWTKTYMDKDGKTTREGLAENPIKQNANHVKHLKRLVADPTVPVYSISVISNKCDFSNIEVKSDNTFMFHLKAFIQGIRGIMDSTEPCLSSERIKKLHSIICS